MQPRNCVECLITKEILWFPRAPACFRSTGGRKFVQRGAVALSGAMDNVNGASMISDVITIDGGGGGGATTFPWLGESTVATKVHSRQSDMR